MRPVRICLGWILAVLARGLLGRYIGIIVELSSSSTQDDVVKSCFTAYRHTNMDGGAQSDHVNSEDDQLHDERLNINFFLKTYRLTKKFVLSRPNTTASPQPGIVPRAPA